MDQISVIFGWTLEIMGVVLIVKPFILRPGGRQQEVKEAKDTILQVAGGLSLYWGYTLLSPKSPLSAMGPLVFVMGGVALVWTYLILLQKIRNYHEKQEELMAQELGFYAEQLKKKKGAEASQREEKNS